MSVARELLRPNTRGIFRDLMTDSTYNEISRAFQDEGFAPDPDCTWDDGSVRRTTAQQYLSAVNWADPHPPRHPRPAAPLSCANDHEAHPRP